jgi:hypothetical protein
MAYSKQGQGMGKGTRHLSDRCPREFAELPRPLSISPLGDGHVCHHPEPGRCFTKRKAAGVSLGAFLYTRPWPQAFLPPARAGLQGSPRVCMKGVGVSQQNRACRDNSGAQGDGVPLGLF